MNSNVIKKHLRSGDLANVRQLFESTCKPDLLSWTALISDYTKIGRPQDGINLYIETKKSKRLIPDKFVILAAAKACATLGDLRNSKAIYIDAVVYGYSSDLFLGNALIDMFGKCKYYKGAERVFYELPEKDVISWTSFCSCYVTCRLPDKALGAFRHMGLCGIRPNAMTLSSIIPACADLKCLNSGREIHGFVVKNWMEDNKFVSSALVDMYSSCLSIKNAEIVFDKIRDPDTVLWNSIISAYFLNGECDKALEKFHLMRFRGIKLDIASWNSVIAGSIRSGMHQKGFELFGQMQQLGSKPNEITLMSMLNSCTHFGGFRQGMEIHGYIVRKFMLKDLQSSTALVLMYGKCGCLEMSQKVFNMMPEKDTVAWNTVIVANSIHGRGEEALSLFHEMTNSGFKPNSVTFTGVLSGCSHSRMVDEGLHIFHTMKKNHQVDPDSEHYSCIVDALSRAGRLAEAYSFIQQMPIEPSASAWGSLLGACRVYNNVDLARIAANRLFEAEPSNPGNYTLFFNILVTAKLREEASDVRKLMRDRGVEKFPGCSWVEVDNKVHKFVAGEKNGEQIVEIQRFLNGIREKMKFAGYSPAIDFVLQDLNGEESEESLCNHSEKLAVAFAILHLKGKTTIRVFKNLRICGDCHYTIKFIAKLVGVTIIVRDSLRFHHFADGLCSCNDFW